MRGALMGFAKTTRPDVKGMMRRPHVERLLARRSPAPLTWIWGPPGAGKTTVVASFLASRRLRTLWYQVDASDADAATLFYYLGRTFSRSGASLPILAPESRATLAAFSRGFFKKLYARLRHRFALVLDNYHEVANDSALHEVLGTAVAELPSRGRILVISRTPTPEALRALAPRDEIDWTQLRVTASEARRLAVRYSPRRPPVSDVQRLFALTDGWMAGLVLLLRRDLRDTPAVRHEVPQLLFDYFAGEIFDRADADTQDVLLQTAFLPPFSAQAAIDLTERPSAGDIVASLQRAGYFTTRGAGAEGRYQFHPLFQQFLQTRARTTWPPDARARLQRRAALLAERDGVFDAAAELLRGAGEWDLLADLAERQTPALMGQGRIETADAWIGAIPESIVTARPWLLCWRAVCRLGRDDEACRRDGERAQTAFRQTKDLNGALLSWSTVVTSFLMQGKVTPLDTWIEELEHLLRTLPGRPEPHVEARVATAMLLAIVYSRPGHPDGQRWADMALEATARTPDPLLRGVAAFGWVLYGWLTGNTRKTAEALDFVRDLGRHADVSPLVELHAGLAAVWHEHFSAAPSWKDTVERLLTLAHSSGLGRHSIVASLLTCGAFTAFSENDVETARAWLYELEGMIERFDSAFVAAYHGLQMRDALEHDTARRAAALRHVAEGRHAADHPLARVFGHACAAYLCCATGDTAAAAAEAQACVREAEDVGAPFLRWIAYLTEAHVRYLVGDDAAGERALRVAMELGRNAGFVNSDVWVPRIMADLCARALDAGIEVEYVRELILRRRLVCPSRRAPAAWPWMVKIHTVPALDVRVREQQLLWKGRMPRRSMALLEHLVGCGPHGAEDSQLMDRFWPESEGDVAARALATAVFRLKRMLGTDEAVVRSGGRTCLNPAVCWVEAWREAREEAGVLSKRV